LLTPVGLRTLEPGDPDYWPRYEGSPIERDGAYHQGTVWPWLLGPFVDAYLAAFGSTETTLNYCRGLIELLEAESSEGGCLSSIAEVYDGDEPRRPGGCPAQAWSVAEVKRVRAMYGWNRGNAGPAIV
jgi:glycogen debranching enzyme